MGYELTNYGVTEHLYRGTMCVNFVKIADPPRPTLALGAPPAECVIYMRARLQMLTTLEFRNRFC